jgi:CMP-N-acetylneuraminic acid synthetase
MVKTMPETLAVIIGRAGSKGLPGKNVREIAGRPCLCWTIDDALAADRIDRVVVSTDSEPLAEIARTMGVDVVMRPAELARDDTPVDAAVRHAVESADRQGAVRRIVILYANVPARPPGLIDRAIELLDGSGAHSVQSYAPVGKHHPLWTAVIGESGAVRPWQGDVLNAGIFRRQDLPPAHIPDGGVIAVTREALFLDRAGKDNGPHAFFGTDRRGILTNEGEVVDIDTEIDALVADAILRRRSPTSATPPSPAGAPR